MICIRLALEQKEENINGINKISPEAAGYRCYGNPVPDRVRSSVCSWRKAGADADHGNDAAEISALFAAYMYINASFEPGQKVKQSYTKCTSITLNKTLKQKYNPDFKAAIQP